MIEFLSVTIKNFLSYGAIPTTVVLNKPGTTIILGEDLDDTSSGAGANGVGKFLHVDCLVKTPSGWIRNGDIKIGQELQMPDGSIAPVNGVFPQGKQPLYKVTFADGRSTLAGGPHLWAVFSHRWGKQGTRGSKTITTENLIQYLKESNERNNKPWYNIFVPTITHPEISDIDLPIDPYLLGVLLGDGCISQPQNIITSSDESIISECKTILENEYGHTIKMNGKDSYNNGYDYSIINNSNHKPFNELLKQLNLKGCISNNKFIPPEYLDGTSKQQKLNLLAGLLDTDGTVGKTKNVSFCSVSNQLAKDVQYLIRSLGGKATITTREPYYTDNNGDKIQGQLAYNVSIRYSTPNDLFHLTRKLDRLSEGRTQYANEGLRVTSVEQVDDGEALCIMVDHPDHLYITDNFVVTHNTVILNALVYACYDRAISEIQKDNLINNINKKKMEVSVSFIASGKRYIITRYRKMKAGAAGNYAVLLEDGKDITPDSIANTNKLLQEIIGMPYEIFIRVVAFSATLVPFLDLPVRSHYAANQTDIIEELFDLKSLSEKAEMLKEVIKDTTVSIKTHGIRLDQQQLEIDRHKEQIASAENRVSKWVTDNKSELSDIQRKLKKVDDVDVEEQQQLNQELGKLTTILQDLLPNQRTIEIAIKQVAPKLKKSNEELDHLANDECPYCLQKYPNAKTAIKECKADIKRYTKEIDTLSADLTVVDANVEEINGKITVVSKLMTVSNVEELLEIKSKQSVYENRLEVLRHVVNPFVEPLEELNNVEFDDINMDKINELTTLIDHQKFLLKLLTKKDSFVRKTLLNKNIPFLNARLQHYLTDLGLPHTVEFTHEMTASISQFGRPMDFGNLSNGQRARVNLALSFAFRDVLQHRTSRVNVCMLDEVLDVGLDTVGVQSAARMLKRKARDEGLALFIITHRDEIDSAFDNKMVVQLEKGFSYIKEI